MLDVDLLMSFQYSLPLTTTPLSDLAEMLGREYEEVERKLAEYRLGGVVKRYGVNLNYRAFSEVRQAALVGLKVDESQIRDAAEIINRFDEVKVKHNFLRDSEFSIWFTIKGRDVEEIRSTVERIAITCGAEDMVLLPTKRVYKMDVKYDLRKGVSWSERGVEAEEVAKVSDVGLNEDFVRSLESLDFERRPFLKFREFGYGEEEVVSIVEELIAKGIGRDFSGVLRESGIGFRENGMTVVKINGDAERVALKLHKSFPQITHLVERHVCEKWNYPLYYMVHATRREPIEEIRMAVLEFDEVAEAKTIYSRRNLREKV